MKAWRRFQQHGKTHQPMILRADHPALRAGRTIFPGSVSRPDGDVLKSGQHQRKIGHLVTKGPWAGMPIFTLTLEERATCPRDCHHWRSCYGNRMHWPQRWRAGPDLEARLAIEVAALARRYPRGFVVRLHVLGDFYSVAYVRLWARLLDQHPPLRVFGYTARDPVGDPIGVHLDALSRERWGRFAIRFSMSWRAERSAVTLRERGRVPAQIGIMCPAQDRDAVCCASCALCWGTARNIFFQIH